MAGQRRNCGRGRLSQSAHCVTQLPKYVNFIRIGIYISLYKYEGTILQGQTVSRNGAFYLNGDSLNATTKRKNYKAKRKRKNRQMSYLTRICK